MKHRKACLYIQKLTSEKSFSLRMDFLGLPSTKEIKLVSIHMHGKSEQDIDGNKCLNPRNEGNN